ncbi:MAG TPA: hypothetical protein EYP46_00025 [Hadesarchaea archaeon]|nr:hypothetical protein [Hadesarchaea archaeon]
MEVGNVREFENARSQREDVSTLRIVAKRNGRGPYTANIPVKGATFSLVLPGGYINWPKGRPYPDSIRVAIDDTRNLWVNFGVSREHGFYTSLRIGEVRE